MSILSSFLKPAPIAPTDRQRFAALEVAAVSKRERLIERWNAVLAEFNEREVSYGAHGFVF